jgi:hypothetical protein
VGKKITGVAVAGGVRHASGADSIDSLTVSADGRNVYGTGYMSDARSGGLRELPAPFSCLSPYPYSGCHLDARGLWSPAMVALSLGGHSVYVSGQESDALMLFTRHTR